MKVSKKQRTLLISIDGLRGDFYEVYGDEVLPNLRKLASEAIYAPNILNQFNSLTLPNHISIVTGLHSQNHGFVGNVMYDHEIHEHWTSWRYHDEHKSEDHENPTKIIRWWEHGLAYPGEPIWRTVTKSGGRCGIFEWPAACGLVDGDDKTTKLVINCHGKKTIEERVDTVVSWLEGNSDVDACDFVAFYIGETDTMEHEDGPFGSKTKEVFKNVDSGIGYLIEQLKAKDLWSVTNLIITSDHGHVEMDPERIVSIDRYVDKHLYLQRDLSFWPIGCTAESLHERLSKLPHCRVFKRHELSKYHYSEHQRIGPIVVVPDPGAWLVREKELNQRWAGRGNHGYDPYHCKEMRPPLVCIGPAIKKGPVKVSHQIDQTDIYLLLCHTLDLRPAPCNGDIGRLAEILAD